MSYTPGTAYLRGKTRKRRRKNSFLIGGAALLFILLLLYLIFFTGLFKKQSVATPISLPSNVEIASSSKGFYYMNGTTLVSADFTGKELWRASYSSAASKLSVSDTLICIYDETSATVIGPDQTPYFSLRPSEFKIISAVAGTTSVAFLTQIEGANQSQYLRVFSTSGGNVELDRSEITGDKVLKYGLYGTNDNLWTLTLDTTGVSPVSRITTRNPSQQKWTGVIDVSEQLISDVFFSSTDMYLSGTTHLSRYNSFSEKQADTLIYGLKCVDTATLDDGSVFAYIPRNSDQTTYTVRILSTSAKSPQDTLLQLPKGVFDMICTGNRIYCFSKDSVYQYKLSGEFISQTSLDFQLSHAAKLTPAQARLIDKDGNSYLYKLS